MHGSVGREKFYRPICPYHNLMISISANWAVITRDWYYAYMQPSY